jgi:hypothetical protein
VKRFLERRLAVLATAVTFSAGAQQARVETAALSWVRAEGAESCPAEADVARSIEQRLGRPTLVARASAELVLETKLSVLSDGRFRADIAMFRGNELVGQRDLESVGPSCQVLAENAALVIALTIDPDVSLEPLPIEAAPLETPEPPPPPRPPPVVNEPPKVAAPAPPAREAEPWQGDLELAGGVATGIVPNVAPGVLVRARALPPELPIGLELQGAFFPAQRIEAVAGKGADFTEFYAGAAACNRPPRERRLRALFCAGADVGAVAGQGYGFAVTPRFRTWTLALAARGRLGFRLLPELALVAGPDFEVPLKRDYFEAHTLTGTERLFRMSAVGLGFSLGVVWEL